MDTVESLQGPEGDTSLALAAVLGTGWHAELGLVRIAPLVVSLVAAALEATALYHMLARARENIYKRQPSSILGTEEITMLCGGGGILHVFVAFRCFFY